MRVGGGRSDRHSHCLLNLLLPAPFSSRLFLSTLVYSCLLLSTLVYSCRTYSCLLFSHIVTVVSWSLLTILSYQLECRIQVVIFPDSPHLRNEVLMKRAHINNDVISAIYFETNNLFSSQLRKLLVFWNIELHNR